MICLYSNLLQFPRTSHFTRRVYVCIRARSRVACACHMELTGGYTRMYLLVVIAHSEVLKSFQKT